MNIDKYLAQVREKYRPAMDKIPGDEAKNIFAACVNEYALHVLLNELGHQNHMSLQLSKMTTMVMHAQAGMGLSEAQAAITALERDITGLAKAEAKLGKT